MKRNKQSSRAMRNKSTADSKKRGTKSRYAAKVARGKQMYGDGHVCCAHRIKIAGVPQPATIV